jgi:hypothetical protein
MPVNFLNSLKIISILILVYLFGFFTNKFKIFPYAVIVETKNKISLFFLNQKTSENSEYIEKLEKLENKIREENIFWDREIRIVKYYPGLNMFSDRNYYNRLNDRYLQNMHLIQVPRHYQKKINIEFFYDSIVYVAICKKNDNSKYLGWIKEDYTILTIGGSCIHQDIYKKFFTKGKVSFDSGGPHSSNPHFIYSSVGDSAFRIVDKF